MKQYLAATSIASFACAFSATATAAEFEIRNPVTMVMTGTIEQGDYNKFLTTYTTMLDSAAQRWDATPGGIPIMPLFMYLYSSVPEIKEWIVWWVLCGC